ncbi:MAG: sugar ABC transporter permease [Actinobacteria bacterium]|nr:sugar ABC transporter permease [Actinomycetota bacterium]
MSTIIIRRPRRAGGSGVLYLLPFVIIFGVFGLFPLVYSGIVSLNDVNLQNPSMMTFIGLQNYGKLFADPFFWNALWNTITLGVLACGPQLIIALGVANLLNYKMRFQTFWRVIILIPYATSVAAATLIFAQLYGHDYGLINSIISSVGLPKVDWQGGTFASQFAIATIVTWRWMGYNALIYLASMQSIPDELYEAAELDGASKWRQFVSVTLPSIRGTIMFTVVISTIGALQLFVEPLLYEGGSIGVQGGVSRQYQTLTLYMYQQGWTYFHLGYASSIAFSVLLLVIIALGGGYLVRAAIVRTRARALSFTPKAVS